MAKVKDLKDIQNAIDEYGRLTEIIKEAEAQRKEHAELIKSHAESNNQVGHDLFGNVFKAKVIERHTPTYSARELYNRMAGSNRAHFFEVVKVVAREALKFVPKDKLDECQDGETVTLALSDAVRIRQ